jgi:hypothetical protein
LLLLLLLSSDFFLLEGCETEHSDELSSAAFVCVVFFVSIANPRTGRVERWFSAFTYNKQQAPPRATSTVSAPDFRFRTELPGFGFILNP